MNAKGDTFDATNESYETVDCVPIEPGDPLQYQILEMTVFMSVKRITHLLLRLPGSLFRWCVEQAAKKTGDGNLLDGLT